MPRNSQFSSPAAPRENSPLDGVLVVDKPAGPTSHDVVASVRRRFRLKKVGHGGTLDPRATGVLILLLGKGTKLSEDFLSSDKTYEGVMRLGIATDSHDADGNVTARADASGITQEQVELALKAHTGDQHQTPPMVSAVKVDGVPLYKRARKGQTVERKARFIHVYEFRLLDFSPPDVQFIIRCTKGTYVRTLCADIGEELGCGAHLAALRRTSCGQHEIGQAMPLEDILALTPEQLGTHVLPVHTFSLSARRAAHKKSSARSDGRHTP